MNRMVCFFGIVVLFLFVSAGNVCAQGIIRVIAGNSISQYIGDGSPATSYSLGYPQSIFVDKTGKIYIAENSNQRIRTLKNDTLATIAGNGTTGYLGDGGPAASAVFQNPDGVCLDTAGNIYITEWYNDVVRKIDAVSGVINTVCGTGTGGFGGDGGPATLATMEAPYASCVDRAGNIYIPDYGNHRIRMVDAATGVISTIAGTGINGYLGNGGLAVNAWLSYPNSICVDTAGNIYFTEVGNNVVRRIDAVTKIITKVAGTAVQGYSGDWGPANAAQLSQPNCVFADKRGNIYISDFGNNVVRAIDHAGIIYTIAGSGGYGFTGDGGLALNATFRGPAAVATDDSGYIYIADGGNSVIWKVSPLVLAVEEVAMPHTAVFPNPSAGKFTLTANRQYNDCEVTVYNTVGQVVYQNAMASQRIDIDITGVPPGMYMVQYSNPAGRVVQKLLIR